MISDPCKSDPLQYVPMSLHALNPSEHLNLVNWVILLSRIQLCRVECIHNSLILVGSLNDVCCNSCATAI